MHSSSSSSLSTEKNRPTISPPSSVSADETLLSCNDVAVIGYGCRLPGGNNNPDQLWEYLMKKGDASGQIPRARWAPYVNRLAENADILAEITSKGYFLNGLENFDPSFFGISPREAEQMDPQQRIAVEVAWEALEHAGIPIHTLAKSDTAVYMGVNSDDYARLVLEDLPNVGAWMGVGTAFCGIPNRISYLFDLMGPSEAIDAACASSLVAIHHGSQALIARETSLVIAGGVNALIGPGLTRVLDKAGALSSDGRCRSFDEAAAGYGRGEGAGIVVLKRLSDALRDEDHVLAVLKGSAVGSDGRTLGIMAPNQDAQERVARKALKEACLSANAISYIEAHATSTLVGDPVECAAMANVYGLEASRTMSDPCYIGSIKSNIGHLEAGAGVMGFIKAILVLQRGLIPPQANLITPNSKIDWHNSYLKVSKEPTVLPTDKSPRRVAVASYGYGGTVSHAIIEAAPSILPSSMHAHFRNSRTAEDLTVLLFSAPQPSRLRSVAMRLAAWLKEHEHLHEKGIDLASVAYTLAVKRTHHQYRAAIVTGSCADATELLTGFAHGQHNSQIHDDQALAKSEDRGLIWVFSGHGAQWEKMGQSLMHDEPTFLQVVEQLEPVIQQQMGFSVTHALAYAEFNGVDQIQILTYVMQVGLAALLQSKGVQPKAVVGHSLGELAAAVVAGAITLVEGAMICCIRSRLYRKVAGSGAMVLVNIPFHVVACELGSRGDIVAAIDSSPDSCVIAGAIDAVQEFSARWEKAGHTIYTVKSDVAFHGPSMLQLADPLRKALEGALSPKPPKIPIYSTSLLDPRAAVLRDTEYWVNNMIKPVFLTPAITAAANDGHRKFLEISSHPIVTHSIKETLKDTSRVGIRVLPTLTRDKPTRKSILLLLGKLHCIGESVDFSTFIPGNWLCDVPGTIWEHQAYWRQVSSAAMKKDLTHNVSSHQLLGRRTQIFGTHVSVWDTHLDPSVKPFPGNHPLHGVEIVPAAVLLNTFFSAAPGHSLRNVSFRVPVVVGSPRDVQVLLEDNQIRISSRMTELGSENDDNRSWLTNTISEITAERDLSPGVAIDLETLKGRLPRKLSDSFTLDYLGKVGVAEMGFPWKVLEHLENDEEMLAKVHDGFEVRSTNESIKFSWASILDAATSIGSTIFHRSPFLRMPTSIGSVTALPDTLPSMDCYIYVKRVFDADNTAHITVLDGRGNILIRVENLRFAGIDGDNMAYKSGIDYVYRIAWPPAQLVECPLYFRSVLFISQESSLLRSYRRELSILGIETETITGAEGLRCVKQDSIVVLLPDSAETAEEVYRISKQSCQKLLKAVKTLSRTAPRATLFCITQNSAKASDYGTLSYAPLLGLARIIHSEEAKTFGGLIDVEDAIFPMQAIRYVQGVDVIKMEDGVARNARLRPFASSAPNKATNQGSFCVRPQGTYLITGGLGALGLETASFLAVKGAKRLVLISRRSLPPRREWANRNNDHIIRRVLSLEAMGVSIATVSIDMTSPSAASELLSSLESLSLPPVLGVVHAAGTLANQLVMETAAETFEHVTAPKIMGAMALHAAFPPRKLDFMVLFSSCGQLLGFPGQASYASGNAFLDALASHRHALGDNTTSFLWTSWRGLGMAASTRYIDAELHSRGVADIDTDKAFAAWEAMSKYRSDNAVILRTLTLEPDDRLPHPILADVVRRREASAVTAGTTQSLSVEPRSGPELAEYLTQKITECVASTLSLAPNTINPQDILAELGLDSVMTVELRMLLQRVIHVNIVPTLFWSCPTVGHLVQHFAKEKADII